MNYHEDHEKRALNALAADMGLHDGANRDAALGLPVVALGPDSTRKVDAYMKAHGFRDGEYSVSAFDVPHDGTKPGPTTPCRTDAASLDTHAKSVERRQYAAKTGAIMRNVMTARARMFGLLATEEEKAAFLAWEEATNLWIDHIIEGGAH